MFSKHLIYCQVDAFTEPINLKGKPGNKIVLNIEPEDEKQVPTISNVVIKACFEPVGKLSYSVCVCVCVCV